MILRKWLSPLGWFYGGIMAIRNFLYDAGLLKSASFEKPVILVGNLSVGGTGKSPHVAYVVDLLRTRCRVATLSRGYGRSTTGFITADAHATASTIGDEPMMYHTRFPDVGVHVCENRRLGLHRIFSAANAPDVVVMDDGFQHRRVDPSLKILLTTYQRPFMRDSMLPAGDLREPQSGYWRADGIIVTGCPDHLTEAERDAITASIKPLPHQQVFFSSIRYGKPVSFGGHEATDITPSSHCVAFAGIANPAAFFQHLQSQCSEVKSVSFPDHHAFERTRLIEMVGACDLRTVFVTTEKDFVRLQSGGLLDVFKNHAACYIPISIQMNDQASFDKMICDHVEQMQESRNP